MSTRKNAIEAFRFFCLESKDGIVFFFLVEKRMERREMIKRKIENLEKALKKVIFKKC